MKLEKGSCVAGLMALALLGCGGGGPKASTGNNPGGGTTTGTSVSDAVRFATLDKIQSAVDQAVETNGSDAQLAAEIRNLPGIADAGWNADGGVWARFADNRMIGIAEPREDGDAVVANSLATPKARPRDIPNSRDAFLFDAIGDPEVPNPIEKVRADLVQGGYSMMVEGSDKTATVEALKSVKNAAVFLVTAHGGVHMATTSSPLGTYTGAGTSTPVTQENDAKYRADLADGSLNYIYMRHRKNGATYAWKQPHYCFTRNFVRKYMTFAPGSVAIVDACSSAWNDDLQEAFLDKGASVYLGWSNPIKASDGFRALTFFFDRLIGINVASPAEPDAPQRPFGYDEIYREMGEKNPPLNDFESRDNHRTKLKMSSNSSDGLNLGIKTMTVDEELNELHLEGSFSREAGTVQMNGHNLRVKEWDESGITCDLPISGADSSGDVQAFYQGRSSNVETLTEWNGALDYTYKDGGTLKQTVHADLRFRADAARLRQTAGQSLEEVSHAFRITNDMTANFTASGGYRDDTSSVTWSGSATLLAPPPSSDLGSRIYGGVSGGKLWWKYDFLTGNVNHIVRTDHGKVTTNDVSAGGPLGQLGDEEDNKIEMPLAADLVFPAGERTATFTAYEGPGKATSTLKWTAFTPTHLPHTGAAR